MAQIGVGISDIRPPDVDETPKSSELPRDYCRRITRSKAQAVTLAPDEVLLVGDTTVALGRRIMGKPCDRDEAAHFLRAMSGRRHRVITAIAVRKGDRIWEKDVVSHVRMKCLSDAEILAYLETNDWQGKAGGYGIQGPAGAFIPWISGSYSAIMGLPVAETASLLQAAGFPIFKELP